jgi:hypothetical protein
MLTALCSVVIAAQLTAGAHALRLSSRRYVWFAALTLVLSLEAAGAVILRLGTDNYMWFWIGIQPAKYAAMGFAALEIVRRLPEHFGNRLGAYGKNVFVRALQASLLLSVLSAFIEVSLVPPVKHSALVLRVTIGFARIFQFLLAVLLALIAWEVYLTQVRLSRNLLRHAMLFATYLWTHVALYLIRNLLTTTARASATALNDAMLVFDATLFAAWVVLLRPAGESLPSKTSDSPEEVAALHAITDRFRQTLRRIVR